MIENQDELRSVLEKNREQAKQIKLLKSGNVCKQDGGPTETDTQLEEAQGSVSIPDTHTLSTHTFYRQTSCLTVLSSSCWF